MSSSVGTLFVEIISKGFAKVQADAEAVKKSLTGVEPVVKALQGRLNQSLFKSATVDASVKQLTDKLANTPLNLQFRMDKGILSVTEAVKKQTEGLSRKVAVRFVAEQIQAVEAEVAKLRAE